MKTKITKEGDLCRKCGNPVIKRIHIDNYKPRHRKYYYKWWFVCQKCHTIYMVEESKVFIDQPPELKFELDTAEDFANKLYEEHPEDFR